jgi:hypothetical protein
MALETVAGGRAWIYSHNVGRNAASGTGFAQPIGVAPAKDGVVYVASRGTDVNPNQRISKVTLDHEFINEFGRKGPTVGGGAAGGTADTGNDFVFLTAITLDADENVYAADEWLNRISIYDKDGNLRGTWGEAGEGEGQLNGPSGLAMDADGNMIVVNSLNSRIQKFTKDGKYISGFGTKGSGEAEMDMPWGVTVDNNGDVFVADWNNHRVQKFSADGNLLATFGHGGTGPGSLQHPTGVAVDGDGDVYVVDWMNERIVIYTADAKPLTYLTGDAVEMSPWGQQSLDANPDQARRRRQVYDLEEQQRFFRMPVACAFDQATNRLIVCDTQRGRLQVYEKDNNYLNPQFNL